MRRAVEIVAYLDGYHFHLSSYHRYINSPLRYVDENVKALQCYGRVYYMTTKDIAPGDELLIYYGPQYSKTLKIDLNIYYQTLPQLLKAGFDLNNEIHHEWVSDAGLSYHEMRNPPSAWIPFFLKRLTE